MGVTKMFKENQKVNNIVNGEVLARNCTFIQYHEYDKNLVILLHPEFGKFVAPISNVVAV